MSHQISSALNECPLNNEVEQHELQLRFEKLTDLQKSYVTSPTNRHIYLEACAGSGKTEVLGVKVAFEISRWTKNNAGIAVLTFTNVARDTIANRIISISRKPIPSNHFVGTIAQFVHGYIAQRFGYKFYGCHDERTDKSYRIIDDGYSKGDWLNNYKLAFPTPLPIFANQINEYSGSQCLDMQEWYYEGSKGYRSELRAAIRSNKWQESIMKSRKNLNLSNSSYQYDFLMQRANECKHRFWKDGFATFSDMNVIAYSCLSDQNICEKISRKFPLIFIDECQDLSLVEIQILSRLMRAGSTIHYVGDLHQAIYTFKGASPNTFSAHIAQGFEIMRLDKNFRSVQEIVDFSRKIEGISFHIDGVSECPFEGPKCCYTEYENAKDCIRYFSKLLKERHLSEENSAVLVRGTDFKKRLLGEDDFNPNVNPLVKAVMLWKERSPVTRRQALMILAYQLQSMFDFTGEKDNFYYCKDVCDSPLVWRRLLRDIPVAFCADSTIPLLDNINYSQWYKTNRRKVFEIINYHFIKIGKQLENTRKIMAAKNTGNSAIISNYNVPKITVDVKTIHSVKGCTFDAVLLLSTESKTGQEGYWENWLNDENELRRICYVACTRPQYFLCWGVSKLNETQKLRLENLGLSKI